MTYSVAGFGTRLIELRREQGYSRKKLADLMKCGEEMVYRWEFGIAHPNCMNLCKIANYFNVSIDWLLSGNAVEEVVDSTSDSLGTGGDVSP